MNRWVSEYEAPCWAAPLWTPSSRSLVSPRLRRPLMLNIASRPLINSSSVLSAAPPALILPSAPRIGSSSEGPGRDATWAPAAAPDFRGAPRWEEGPHHTEAGAPLHLFNTLSLVCTQQEGEELSSQTLLEQTLTRVRKEFIVHLQPQENTD